MNGGAPVWTFTQHLLADLWVLMVQVNSEKDALPQGFDHPARAAITTKAKAGAMAALKAKYQQRKRDRAQRQVTRNQSAQWASREPGAPGVHVERGGGADG